MLPRFEADQCARAFRIAFWSGDSKDSHGWPRSLVFSVRQSRRKNIHSMTTTRSKITAVLWHHSKIFVHPLKPSKHSKYILSSHKALHWFRWPTTRPDTVFKV